MNMIAVGTIVLGVLLLVFGLLLLAKQRRASGFTLALLGLVIAVAPFAITYFLFR